LGESGSARKAGWWENQNSIKSNGCVKQLKERETRILCEKKKKTAEGSQRLLKGVDKPKVARGILPSGMLFQARAKNSHNYVREEKRVDRIGGKREYHWSYG